MWFCAWSKLETKTSPHVPPFLVNESGSRWPNRCRVVAMELSDCQAWPKNGCCKHHAYGAYGGSTALRSAFWLACLLTSHKTLSITRIQHILVPQARQWSLSRELWHQLLHTKIVEVVHETAECWRIPALLQQLCNLYSTTVVQLLWEAVNQFARSVRG